eukprot:scaffold813_cov148-Amphora_coffeaeformis.AAC.4
MVWRENGFRTERLAFHFAKGFEMMTGIHTPHTTATGTLIPNRYCIKSLNLIQDQTVSSEIVPWSCQQYDGSTGFTPESVTNGQHKIIITSMIGKESTMVVPCGPRSMGPNWRSWDMKTGSVSTTPSRYTPPCNPKRRFCSLDSWYV